MVSFKGVLKDRKIVDIDLKPHIENWEKNLDLTVFYKNHYHITNRKISG